MADNENASSSDLEDLHVNPLKITAKYFVRK